MVHIIRHTGDGLSLATIITVINIIIVVICFKRQLSAHFVILLVRHTSSETPKIWVWTVTYHVTSQKWSHPMNCPYFVEIVQA
jgi:hypothetical protein